ncbi:MAG: hypothetical protein GF349_00825 [Candidatus Magasanikbacteria bacterium]|nr:hypothetical protein [Candidatus Magasanikbacteria bacterium]
MEEKRKAGLARLKKESMKRLIDKFDDEKFIEKIAKSLAFSHHNKLRQKQYGRIRFLRGVIDKPTERIRRYNRHRFHYSIYEIDANDIEYFGRRLWAECLRLRLARKQEWLAKQ